MIPREKKLCSLANLKSLRHCQNNENNLEKALIFLHTLVLWNPKLHSSPALNPDPPLAKATQKWVSRWQLPPRI